LFCSNCGSSIADGSPFCPACGTRSSLTAAPQGALPVPIPAPLTPIPVTGYATWGTRVGGYIIDHILVAAVMGLLYLLLGGMLTGLAGLGGHDAASGLCCLVIMLFPVATLLVGFYNRVYLVSQRGYSIGQGIVHVKVVDANGNLLTQGTAFVRLLVQAGMGLVPFLPVLDLLWPLWDEQRQTLHDKAVGSYVINNP
jgi:uncharacterized RDD family membrane protein YckC